MNVEFFFGVGGEIAFVRSIVIPPELLQTLAKHGINLECTAYPLARSSKSGPQ